MSVKKKAKKKTTKKVAKKKTAKKAASKAPLRKAAKSIQILDGLSQQDLTFVVEYCAHGNATRAAKSAGIKEGAASDWGHRRLRDPEIRLAIRNKYKEIKETMRNFVSDKLLEATEIRLEMAQLAFAMISSQHKVVEGMVFTDGMTKVIALKELYKMMGYYDESGPSDKKGDPKTLNRAVSNALDKIRKRR